MFVGGHEIINDNDLSSIASSEPKIANWTTAGLYISEVYVMYKSGVVLLSRRFEKSQVSSDPQLVGGFLSALSDFVQSVMRDHACNIFGEHELLDIGISCSRWLIKSTGDFTVAVLIQNDSPLIQRGLWHVIDEFAHRVSISFDIFYQFVSFKTQSILLSEDYSEDFGNTVDYVLFETLSEFTDENITFDDSSPTMDFGFMGFEVEDMED